MEQGQKEVSFSDSMLKNLRLMGIYETGKYLDHNKLHDALCKGIIDLDILINAIQWINYTYTIIKFDCNNKLTKMVDGRMNFFGMADDKLYYDEAKKRFVNTKNAPAHVERAYKNSHFKDVSTLINLNCIVIVTPWFVRIREARILD